MQAQATLSATTFGDNGAPVIISRALVDLPNAGRVEALVGLGRLDDARVQLEGVREDDRSLQAVSLTTARLALAQRPDTERGTMVH